MKIYYHLKKNHFIFLVRDTLVILSTLRDIPSLTIIANFKKRHAAFLLDSGIRPPLVKHCFHTCSDSVSPHDCVSVIIMFILPIGKQPLVNTHLLNILCVAGFGEALRLPSWVRNETWSEEIASLGEIGWLREQE